MILTREEAIAEHRKMWRWIAEETVKQQEFVYEWKYMEKYFPKDVIENICFCCEYSTQKKLFEGTHKCDFCPIDWGGKFSNYMCVDKEYADDDKGLFALWVNAKDWKEAAELARQIAELPERQV